MVNDIEINIEVKTSKGFIDAEEGLFDTFIVKIKPSKTQLIKAATMYFKIILQKYFREIFYKFEEEKDIKFRGEILNFTYKKGE